MTHEHDKGFKDILTNPYAFTELVQCFVDTPLAALIKPENLELVNTEFILSTFEKRNADVIYRLRISDTEQDVYFYCLLELQSKPDYSMPIRLFVYTANLLAYILKGIDESTLERKDFRLPVVIPIVLYNGKGMWHVPLQFSELYEKALYSMFKEYALDFKYHLIDVNRLDPEELLKIGNLISAVFYVDQQADTKDGEEYIKSLPAKLKAVEPILREIDGEDKREGNIFLRWMKGIILERIPVGESELRAMIEEFLTKIEEETEVSMFVSNLSREFGDFVRRYDEGMTKLSNTEAKLVLVEQNWAMDKEKLSHTSEKLSLAEQEKVKAEQEKAKAEQEKVKAEQMLSKAVLLMRKQGLSLDEIACETGLSRSEISAYTEE